MAELGLLGAGAVGSGVGGTRRLTGSGVRKFMGSAVLLFASFKVYATFVGSAKLMGQ